MQKSAAPQTSQDRANVFDAFANGNLADQSPNQVLQLILTYVIPRGDVTELAQRLLERFGTVQNVLDAPEHSLMQVKGINERAAKLLCGFVKIFDYYTNNKMSKKTKMSDWNDIYDLCESLVRFQSKETLYIIGLDENFRKTDCRKIGVGSTSTVSLNSAVICDFIIETKSPYIILTHNHPGGKCKPSTTDKVTTDQAGDIAKMLHSTLLEHAVVGYDGIYSIIFNKKVRSFVDTEDIKKMAGLGEGQNLQE